MFSLFECVTKMGQLDNRIGGYCCNMYLLLLLCTKLKSKKSLQIINTKNPKKDDKAL